MPPGTQPSEPGRETAAPKPERLRLFVALDLPDERRRAIHGWVARTLAATGAGAETSSAGAATSAAGAGPVGPLRIVRPESLHVTLAFLGHHPAEAADRAAALLREVAPRPVRLTPAGELVPMPRSRPRLVALGLESPDAVAIHAELAPRLVAEGLWEPERRPFWPHVTLVRARGGKHERSARKALRGPLPALPDELLEPFGAVRLALYRSLLRPDGSQYVSLANLDLPPAATSPARNER